MSRANFEGVGTVRTRKGEDLADQLEAVVRDVEARGIRVSPLSRLLEYLPLLRARSTEFLEEVSQAHLAADEIVTAVEHLLVPPEPFGWANMFQDIQRGPLLASLHHDRAREKQTELLMGGLMRSAGAVVEFREPDAQARVGQNGVSFAAKRPTSISNFLKTLRDGRNQLARAGGVGVLFVDISPLATQFSKPFAAPSIESATQALDRPLDATIREIIEPAILQLRGSRSGTKTTAALVAVLNARFFVPSVAAERALFGTLRRLHADAAADTGFVPKWLFEFVLRFNRMGVSPKPTT
jgi:hypothetical protein